MEELGISVITPTRRRQNIEWLLENFWRQEYINKELIIILNSNEMKVEEITTYTKGNPQIKVFQLDEKESLGNCLNFGIAKASYEYISRFDDDDYYGSGYLKEVDQTFKLNACDVVNKASLFAYFKEEKLLIQRFCGHEGEDSRLAGGAVLSLRKALLDEIIFESVPYGEDTIFLQHCLEKQFKICSSSRYHFMAMREGDVTKHTFQLEMGAYLRNRETKVIARQIEEEEAHQIIDQKNI